MVLSLCDNSTVQEVMGLINLAIKIIRIAVPIILIVSLSLKIASCVSSGNDIKDMSNVIISRIVAAILVFFVPYFVNIIAHATMVGTEYESCLDVSIIGSLSDSKKKEIESIVSRAESVISESEYQTALSRVNKLDDGAYKSTLLERLKSLKSKIDLKNDVAYGIKNANESNYSELLKRVNELEDGDLKTKLLADLETIRKRLNEENSRFISAPGINRNSDFGDIANIDPNHSPRQYGDYPNITVNYYNGFSYWVYTPTNMSGNLPMIVYLHGLGSRGNDYVNNSTLAINDGPIREIISYGYEIDAVIVHMQVPGNDYVQNYIGKFHDLTDKIADELNTDKAKISLAGFSHGCYGSVHMVNNYRKYFSASVLIGCTVTNAEAFRYTPVWAFVGSGDGASTMPGFVNNVNSLGGTAKFTSAPYKNHNIVCAEYSIFRDESLNLFEWMLSQTRSDVG